MSADAISVESLTVKYGNFEALKDISFSAPEGAFIAVIGPNGSGKTTLLNTLVGLQEPTHGSLRLFGAPPNELPATSLGYVPQVKMLDRTFPARALDLVLTGLSRGWPWRIPKQSREIALQAMKRTKIDHLADHSIATLSGGELQRVYLARCLVRSPKLMVLDEPGAGMDLVGEMEMYHILEDYQREKGTTVVMITHDWEGARTHASHVLLIDHQLLGYGPAAEVAQEERLLRVFGFAGHKAASHKGKNNA
ncbi:MAG: metal ABC transporter ATP-binding protein [Candidatus Hydrogenedentes bacterium]|nr:metal ABC transporter ATP-binding protein [Candidatus Hydrogenedentota bacterium]